MTPWKPASPAGRGRRSSCGPRRTASGRTAVTKRCRRFSCSHISLEICSRTPRAFSRARAMQATTASGFVGMPEQELGDGLGACTRRSARGRGRRCRRQAGAARQASPWSGMSASSSAWKLTCKPAARSPRRARRSAPSSRATPRRVLSIRPLSTQVSLLPPPCDELTTSEPGRSAARVRPPGTSEIRVAVQDERPQVDVRRPELVRVDRLAAERDRRLGDELPRVGLDAGVGTPRRSAARRARADQHPVAAARVDRLDDELVEMLEDVATGRASSAPR